MPTPCTVTKMASPAGWYAELTNPNLERFWDGAAWTQQTRPITKTRITGWNKPGSPERIAQDRDLSESVKTYLAKTDQSLDQQLVDDLDTNQSGIDLIDGPIIDTDQIELPEQGRDEIIGVSNEVFTPIIQTPYEDQIPINTLLSRDSEVLKSEVTNDTSKDLSALFDEPLSDSNRLKDQDQNSNGISSDSKDFGDLASVFQEERAWDTGSYSDLGNIFNEVSVEDDQSLLNGNANFWSGSAVIAEHAPIIESPSESTKSRRSEDQSSGNVISPTNNWLSPESMVAGSTPFNSRGFRDESDSNEFLTQPVGQDTKITKPELIPADVAPWDRQQSESIPVQQPWESPSWQQAINSDNDFEIADEDEDEDDIDGQFSQGRKKGRFIRIIAVVLALLAIILYRSGAEPESNGIDSSNSKFVPSIPSQSELDKIFAPQSPSTEEISPRDVSLESLKPDPIKTGNSAQPESPSAGKSVDPDVLVDNGGKVAPGNTLSPLTAPDILSSAYSSGSVFISFIDTGNEGVKKLRYEIIVKSKSGVKKVTTSNLDLRIMGVSRSNCSIKIKTISGTRSSSYATYPCD